MKLRLTEENIKEILYFVERGLKDRMYLQMRLEERTKIYKAAAQKGLETKRKNKLLKEANNVR
jgi:hypothetical protein